MSVRFRLLLIVLGALIVGATYTFPLWQPFFMTQTNSSRFPELTGAMQDEFELSLTAAEQDAFLDLRRENPSLALEMVTARLRPAVVIPFDQQALPIVEGQVPVATGEFNEISPIRKATGEVTIYELPDGRRFAWFQDFNVGWGPGLQVYLSTVTMTMFEEAQDSENEDEKELSVTLDDIFLGTITSNVGSQGFDIPADADLSLYNSIVIYSSELQIIYSIAELLQ